MKAYIPYYDRGRYHIQEAEAEECRTLRNGDLIYRGTIYGPNAFRTEEAARAYINREPIKAGDRLNIGGRGATI